MKKYRCIVRNVDDFASDFYVNHNGDELRGMCGKEIVLTEGQINVLKDAKIDTVIRNPDTNKPEAYQKMRFVVEILGDVRREALEEKLEHPWVCAVCGRDFKYKTYYDTHMRTHSSKKKRYLFKKKEEYTQDKMQKDEGNQEIETIGNMDAENVDIVHTV